MAFSTIWLVVASLIAAFNIEKAREKVRVVGKDGIEREEERTVKLTHEYVSGLSMQVLHYCCYNSVLTSH